MSANRKTQQKSTRSPKPSKREAVGDDKGFQDRLMGLLEWLADKDPVKAARLVGDYLEDLADELGPKAPKPAKG